VHNIGIKGPKDGFGPKQVKLFINRHSFGFSDADSVPCAQQLDLTDKDLDGEPIALKLTKVRLHARLTAQWLACQQSSWGSAAIIVLMQSSRSAGARDNSWGQWQLLVPLMLCNTAEDPQALCAPMRKQSVLDVCMYVCMYVCVSERLVDTPQSLSAKDGQPSATTRFRNQGIGTCSPPKKLLSCCDFMMCVACMCCCCSSTA
jgi:hypothetical protein